MTKLTEGSAWRALEQHYQSVGTTHMRDLFAQEPNRFNIFSRRLKDILVDFSKHRITDETFGLLLDLAREADLEGWRDKMFASRS